MKKIILFLSLALALHAQYSNGQNEPQQLPNYVVTRIDHNYLDFDQIDNDRLTHGRLLELLNEKGKKASEEIKKRTGLDIGNIQVNKIFPHLHTWDSISISRLGKKVYMPPFWATFRCEVPSDSHFWKFSNELKRATPLVLFVDPPIKYELDNIPNDSLFNYQVSLYDTLIPDQTISMNEAWNIETGKSFVKVGVFDTGIDHAHEDLDILTGWAYFNSYESDPVTGLYVNYFGEDRRGHGTNCAGIIGAKRNNGIGIAGIAGGDGSDTSGVSLIDFSLDFSLGSGSTNGENFAMAVIDAARVPGTYYNWSSNPSNIAPNNDYYWGQSIGFGIFVGNHSYGYKVIAEPVSGGKTIPGDTSEYDPFIPLPECNLCREAHLFSLKNGVTNVISRGNNVDITNLTKPNERFPQNFDDTWSITVGASGTDGKRLSAPFNTDPTENWRSPIGINIDVIAPGSKASIATTRSTNLPDTDIFGAYRSFNGTSASAPHVTGVVALLMSYYNKPCYSNVNLDPADVEYIISKSADHANDNVPVGTYDDSTGWGRLNAYKALKMIDFPEYQIVHPQEPATSTQLISTDTITLYVNRPMNTTYAGPLSGSFPITAIDLEKFYRVVRYTYRQEYNFASYRIPSNQLLDVWNRPSETNTYPLYVDTLTVDDGNPATTPVVTFSTMDVAPKAEVVSYTDSTVLMEGFTYQFIGRHFTENDIFSPLTSTNFWYPLNPSTDSIQMAYSIYLRDSVTSQYWDFPCDSINLLMDSTIGLSEPILDIDFQIFPNPGNETIYIQLNQKNTNGFIELRGVSGQLVQHIPVQSPQSSYEISVNHLNSGLYFVTWNNGELSLSKKWIKL